MRRAALSALVLALTSGTLAQPLPVSPRAVPSDAAPRGACELVDEATLTRLRADVDYLASDALGGREPATEGGVAAATYIARALAEIGVEPAGTEAYLQPFRVDYGVEAMPSSQVIVKVGDETRALVLGRDFRVAHAAPFSGNGRAVGALVYAGHGLFSREADWNDFTHGVPVRDRIVVVLSGPPRPTDPARVAALRSAGVVGSLAGKVRAARERGAAAVIEVQLDPREPADTYLPPPGTGIPVVRVTRAQGAWLLGRAEGALAAETLPVAPARLLGSSARVVTSTRRRTITTANVLGVVRGRVAAGAPARGVLLVGAHYDHIGRGAASSLAPGVYAIHNGADDNGSGTVAVLELARRIARTPLTRDVVFAWFGAEELGLVGSRWLVQHRTPFVADITAAINMDMVGRLRECRLFVEARETAAAFAPLVEIANQRFRFDARPWEVSRGQWGASDHMSFIDAHIPSLFLFTGLHDDYHRPSDDAPTLNYPGLGSVVGFAEAILRSAASRADVEPTAFTFAR